MRYVLILTLVLLTGCTSGKIRTITTEPLAATVKQSQATRLELKRIDHDLVLETARLCSERALKSLDYDKVAGCRKFIEDNKPDLVTQEIIRKIDNVNF